MSSHGGGQRRRRGFRDPTWRCASCGKQVRRHEAHIRLRGSVFHARCAAYRRG